MARGIDTFAHRAALASGGRTIAVLGSGLDRIYAEENRGLVAEMQGHEAIATELPLGSPLGLLRRPTAASGVTRVD